MNCAMDKENSNAGPARGAAAGASLIFLQCRAALGRRQGPPRCRALAAIVPAGLAVVMLAGCTSGTPQPAALALSAGCSTAVAAGSVLPTPKPVTAPVNGDPTAVVGTADGRWAFASVSPGAVSVNSGAGIAVLALGHGVPRLVRTVTLPESMTGAYGMAMTRNGLLLVAGYTATAVLSVRALEDGGRDQVVGMLRDAGAGQFEVAVSADDRYVFVTDESTGSLSVFDLATALRHGFSAPGVAVGVVPLAADPVGVAVSPDGARLYVATLGGAGPHGQLWVLDSNRAEAGAGRAAVLAHVAAGCQADRVAVSPDGRTVWVTARLSDALLGFSAADLLGDPSRALQAVVRVGSEPVGLLLVDDGDLALVGNSNRGIVAGTATDVPQVVSLVNTVEALGHRSALLGAVPAGLFPRDLTLDQATGQVLLGNYSSGTVEEFPVPAAPAGA
jgi:6-phosphogluconolactonase (cycloisomerase 2 family)